MFYVHQGCVKYTEKTFDNVTNDFNAVSFKKTTNIHNIRSVVRVTVGRLCQSSRSITEFPAARIPPLLF